MRQQLKDINCVWQTKEQIEKLEEKKQSTLETLTLNGVSYDQIKAGQHGKNQNSAIEDLIIAVENLDTEIARLQQEKIYLQADLLRIFDKVLPAEVVPLFIWRYVNLAEWKRIIPELEYSETHLYQLHRKYLPKVKAEIKKCQ